MPLCLDWCSTDLCLDCATKREQCTERDFGMHALNPWDLAAEATFACAEIPVSWDPVLFYLSGCLYTVWVTIYGAVKED